MKRWKKILLILLAVILLAQIPFIYRRFQTGKLAEKINQLQSQRTNLSNPNFNEYKGIIHAHTNLGGHSTGSFDELIGAANQNELDFVVMTEHFSENYDTSALTLNGFYGKTLFVGGNEVDTASVDRFLMIPGGADAYNLAFDKTETFLEKVHAQNRIALITYPERFKTWDANFDGIEVFSLHTNAKKMNPAIFPLDALWAYGKYPKQLLAKYFVRPDANLQKYDEISAKRKITLFSGTDAHSNIGFHLLGDDAGNKIINLKLDDYATIFGLTRAHILLAKDKQLTRENLIGAIRNGNLFVGIDVLGDTSGFSFTAETNAETKIQGDEIALQNGVKLKANAPQNVRFAIFKNGEKVFEEGGKSETVFEAKEKGTYRVEVYLDALGSPFDKMPWIFSNPIYIR
ncbi:MAG: hypothetical protein LUM44_09170 [Pyrinomonadaceae bacterium]|nr:hypothetical protein [Pyrinomonadaceae bacterium]